MSKQRDTISSSRLRHIALGSELAGEVLVPVLVGLWADNRWESSPIGVLIGTLIALLAVSVTLFRIMKNSSA